MILRKLLLITTLAFSYAHAAYVGDQSCLACHKQEHTLWKDSHHALAMQEVNATTVLGDFNTTFDYNGITTTFFRQDGDFKVRTDGPDGALHDYSVAYVFGIYPLQQYLIPFPNGKFQVLDIAWDSRKKEEGGQRWFHLHPDDNVTAGDPLHWTGPNLNWNYMCADCHSTHLKKNYDAKTQQYATSYEAINVSCEACHGEGSEHVGWAKNPKTYKGTAPKGLSIDLSSFGKDRWKIDKKTGKPVFLGEIDRSEVELCAQCHSFRSQLDDDFTPGERFADHYMASVLNRGLYFPDGKIEGEVYVYGSFLQSKMYAEGVSCSDCHDPHSLHRRAEGEIVCAKCHQRVDYATPKHHHHAVSDATCIDCHMPPRTYMGVDVRNDHSFRVPRPDLSVGTDIPNACTICHKDKDAQWAAEAVKKWYGKVPVGKQNFAHQLEALRAMSNKAPQSLYEVLASDAPDIAKATVAAHLGNYPSKQTYITTLQMLKNDDGLVRLNALQALEAFPLNARAKPTFERLDDPLKIVRVEAARQLSAIPQGELDASLRQKLQKGIQEYEETLIFNADRAESQTALGELYTNLGEPEKAEAAYKEAIRLQPDFVNAYVNFAYFYQAMGNEKAAFDVLQKGLKTVPSQLDKADIYHALGLWYVRQKASDKARDALKKAATLAPDNARYQYIYAVALAESDIPAAIKVLQASLQKHSGDVATLYALASYYKQLGKKDEAARYSQEAQRLQNFVPDMGAGLK